MGGFELVALLLGGAAALLVGFSKTGMPGTAIPAVALMAEAFPNATQQSVGAMLPILLLGDVFAIFYYRRHAHWNRLAELFPWVIAGMIPGYLVLWWIPSDGLRVLLGAIILGLLVLQFARQRMGWGGGVDNRWFTSITGSLAGFGTTVGNAAGPVMSIYLVSKRLSKQEFLGTAAWFFFFVNLSKIPLFVAFGMVNRATLTLDLILFPLVVVGALVGAAAVKHIPQAVFNALVLLLAGAAAVRMLFF